MLRLCPSGCALARRRRELIAFELINPLAFYFYNRRLLSSASVEEAKANSSAKYTFIQLRTPDTQGYTKHY